MYLRLHDHDYWIHCVSLCSQFSQFRPQMESTIHIHHYDDVIMTTIASQITSLTSVYSTVYSDADQRKHQSSASLAFVWGIHRDRWIPRTKGQLRGKCFHLMTSLWCLYQGTARVPFYGGERVECIPIYVQIDIPIYESWKFTDNIYFLKLYKCYLCAQRPCHFYL